MVIFLHEVSKWLWRQFSKYLHEVSFRVGGIFLTRCTWGGIDDMVQESFFDFELNNGNCNVILHDSKLT